MLRPGVLRPGAANELPALFVPPLVCTAAATHELLYNRSGPVDWALAMATVWPLLLRHRAPVGVFWFCWSAAMAGWALDVGSLCDLAVLVALYTVAVNRGSRCSIPAAVACELGVVLVALRVAPAGSVNDGVIILTGLAAAAFLLGTTMRAQHRYLASIEDRAQRLERERAQQARLAAAAERTRIAREMHDIVAHALVVVVALSEAAAATVPGDPEGARGHMLQAAATGRQSLSGMRRLLGMLREDDGADRAPLPGLDALGPLLEEVRRTGLDVRLTETGPRAARKSLGAAAQTTLYRIVQESLTNVVKHADAASEADVALHFASDSVGFSITDDGGAVAPGAVQGNGLTGMRERVALFDGEFQAGPGAVGWSVRGRLRLSEPEAADRTRTGAPR